MKKSADAIFVLQELLASVLFSTTLQQDSPVDKRLLDHLYDASRTETEYIYAIPVSEETFEGRVVGDVSQKKQAAPPLLPKPRWRPIIREAHVKFAHGQTECPPVFPR